MPDPVPAFRKLFEQAVQLRLRSDVPVGVALSGGMDSSAILSLMGRNGGALGERSQLHAFSYMPKEFDEERFILETVSLAGAHLHRTELSPSELWDTLPEVLDAHDEPLHSPTALVGYQVYKLAADAGVRVVLGGQGADETLGGYPSYFSERWLEIARNLSPGRLLSELRAYGRAHSTPLNTLLFSVLYRVLATAVPRSPRLPALPYRFLLNDNFAQAIDQGAPKRIIGLTPVLEHAVEVAPLPLYLRIEDRNSMAHSVEARLPFLDHQVVEFAFRLDSEWKIRGPWNKFLLRQSMKGIIPESVRTRVDKMGFPTGFASWIRGPLREEFRARITDPSLKSLGIFDARAIERCFEEHDKGLADHSLALFNVVQYVQWQGMLGGVPIVPRGKLTSVTPQLAL